MLLAGALVLSAALVCLGYGLLLLRAAQWLRPGLAAGVTLGDAGLLGFGVLGVVATLLNVLLPLGGPVAAAVCLAGVALAGLQHRALAARAGAFGWAPVAALLLLVSACLYLGAKIPGTTTSHFDAGLYHVQAVRLAMEQPLILGIANIHMRFGYNSVVFPTAALLSGGLPGLAAALTGNALLLSFVAVAVLQRALADGAARCLRSTVFGLLAVWLAIFSPLLSVGAWLGTPNSDIPSALMVLYAFYLALRLSDRGDAPEGSGTAALLVVVVALALVLKLSTLPVLALVLLPLLARRRGWIGWQDIACGVGGAAALGLPWLLRGVATSGCLAYPQPASCLPVPWRIDPVLARYDMDWMRSWARRPETPPEIVLADWSWFPDWVATLGREPMRPAFLLLLAVTLGLILARLALRRLVIAADLLPLAAARRDTLHLLIVAMAGIAFWFLTAPLVRYGQAWLVLPLLLGIAHLAPAGWGEATGAARRLDAMPGHWQRRLCAGLVTVVVLISLGGHSWRRLLATGFPHYPEVAVEQRGTIGDLPLNVPREGGQCWDAPILCTPMPRDGLSMQPFGPSRMIRNPA